MELSDGVKATTRLIANNLSILAATSTVPNLIGNDYIDAWYSIYSGYFQIGTVTEKSNEIISAGKVIEQVPAPSSIVNSGSAVDLVISSGPINSIRGSYDGIWSSGDQRITFPVVKGKIPSFALRPSNGACGTTLTTTTYTPPFSISGNSFSFDGHSGTFNTNKSANVVFKYTANGPFCSGSGTVSGPVTKQLSPQTITFGHPPTNMIVGGTGFVSATGGDSGNPVTFSSTTAGVCTISGGTVTGVTAGSCTIAANQLGNANYNDAPQTTQTFTVGKGNQAIGPVTCSPNLLVGGTCTLSASGGASGNPVVFNSTTPAACTTSGTNGSAVTGVLAGTGNCSIDANQAGNINYNAAPQVMQSFNVPAGFGLTVINLNPAGGSVTSDTGGITCGSTCSQSYASGTAVTLTAIPVTGYQFSGWGGSCREYGNTYKLTMDAAKSCTAKFEVFKKKRRPSWRGLLSQ